MRFVSLLFLWFTFSWKIYYSNSRKIWGIINLGGDFYRGYSGYQLFEHSSRTIYYHDLTVSVIETAHNGALKNCELIEVSSDKQRELELHHLEKKFDCKSMSLSFEEMVDLMDQCDDLDYELINQKAVSLLPAIGDRTTASDADSESRWLFFDGIFPGTKWCGPGNIAVNYYDLGTRQDLDRCCRKHDLCPTKILGWDTRYNLKNKNLYTRSHCVCDDEFTNCLRRLKQPMADYLGRIYFNFMQVPCIEEGEDGKQFREAREY